jgi:restriction endonuclease S subunit
VTALLPEAARWFGPVPSGWSAKAIKYGFAVIGSGTTPPSSEARYYGGAIPWVNTSELRENVINEFQSFVTEEALQDFSALRVYPAGTVLFAMYGATIGRVAILGLPATVNQAVCALANPTELDSQFTFYCLQASRDVLNSLASGGGQPNLNSEKVREHRIPCPDSVQQRSIATFLDRETARLDALVATKQRLLDLLAEKRKAIIATAVTRGLDPKVKLRDSGVPWLGEIPAHWGVMRVRHLGTLKGGAGFPHEHQGGEDGELPFFKVKDLGETGVPMIATDNYVSQETATALRAHVFPAKTIVFAKVGAALLLNRFRLLGVPGCIDNNMMGLSLDEERMCVEFALPSLSLIDFKLVANPGAVPSVNEGQVSEYRLPVPPFDEQHAIVAHITRETAKLDAVRAATEHTIALLKERRSALIAAAVTGQLDLTTGAGAAA